MTGTKFQFAVIANKTSQRTKGANVDALNNLEGALEILGWVDERRQFSGGKKHVAAGEDALPATHGERDRPVSGRALDDAARLRSARIMHLHVVACCRGAEQPSAAEQRPPRRRR